MKDKKRLNVEAIYKKGQAKADEAYDKRNIGREDDLRGGNAGARILGKSGKFKTIGKCPRQSLLRHSGIEELKEDNIKLMFDGGFGSEEYLMNKLDLGYTDIVIPEGDIVCEWKTDSGRKVTGTPDGILARQVDSGIEFVEGIEAKCMSSGYTVISCAIHKEPKTAHLIQAAQYSMALGIPFQLVYVSRVMYHIGGFMYNLIGNSTHPCVERKDNGDLFRMTPTMSTFLLDFDDEGMLWYKHSTDVAWTKTFISKESIKEYYNYVDRCINERMIPEKPTKKKPTGERDNFNPCNYCDFKQACILYDTKTFDEWRQACADISD